ncbi:MAG: branched-chain amino acid ABC transporter permease [Variovorax sp.]
MNAPLRPIGLRATYRRDLVLMALLVAAFATIPLWADGGLRFLAGVALVQIVFALSFNVIFGLAGLVSFGHAAYFAAGAYTAGLLLQKGIPIPLPLILVIGALVGGVLALFVAALALRRSSGNYFAILTLALAELLHIVISKSTVLGREDGLTGLKPPRLDLGVTTVDLSQGHALYFLLLVVTLVAGSCAWLLWNGPIGRRLAATRLEPDRAAFLGINVHRARMQAFALSGVGAGLAGAMYAPLAQILTPEVAHWSFSALPILFCLLGGAASFWGPVAGVVVFLGVEHATRTVVGLSEIMIGVTLLTVVLVFPGGLAGGVQRLVHSLGAPRRVPPAGAAAATGAEGKAQA